jgi:hypothetical protein
MLIVSEPAKDPRQGGLCRCEATPAPPTMSNSLWLKANYLFTTLSPVFHPVLQIPLQFRDANRPEFSNRSPTKLTAPRSVGNVFLLWIDKELEKPLLVLVGSNWGLWLVGRPQKDNGHKTFTRSILRERNPPTRSAPLRACRCGSLTNREASAGLPKFVLSLKTIGVPGIVSAFPPVP